MNCWLNVYLIEVNNYFNIGYLFKELFGGKFRVDCFVDVFSVSFLSFRCKNTCFRLCDSNPGTALLINATEGVFSPLSYFATQISRVFTVPTVHQQKCVFTRTQFERTKAKAFTTRKTKYVFLLDVFLFWAFALVNQQNSFFCLSHTLVSNQCDQIGKFNGLWATFQSHN